MSRLYQTIGVDFLSMGNESVFQSGDLVVHSGEYKCPKIKEKKVNLLVTQISISIFTCTHSKLFY